MLQSFRVRIALLSACLSGLVLVLFAAWAWQMVQRSTLGRVDDSLRDIAQRHLLFPHDPSHWAQVDQSLQFVFGEDTGQVVMLVVNSDGKLLHRSVRWPDTLRPVPEIPDHAFTDPVPEFPAPPDQMHLPPRGMHLEHGPPRDALRPPGDGPGPPRDRRDRRPPPPPGAGEIRRGPGGPPGGPPPDPRPVLLLGARTMDGEREAWRVAVFRDPEVTFAIAVELTGYAARIGGARTSFLLAFPLALLLIAVGSWYLATRAMRPVARISRAIAQVTARGLDQRVPDAGESAEFQQLIAQFNKMMERLERSFAQAARFGADAAHELKTPLAVLQGEIEQALQSAPPDTQVVLSRLLDEVQRLKSITQKLLLLARADAGQLSVHAESINLSAMLRELVDDIEITAQNASVKTEIQNDVAVFADRVLLQQLLQNLADNAVKYCDANGVIRFTLGVEGNVVLLRVSNSGAIPEDKQPRIFDRFVRVDDARTRRVDGAGLGLSLAREIARAHGGELTLESAGNGNVTFATRLPLNPGR